MRPTLWLTAAGIGFAVSAGQAQTVNLWPGVAPGSERWTQTEKAVENTPLGTVIFNVVTPTLTAYLPERAKATGAGVIVAPGGAFVALAIDLEGNQVARWLQERGIAAFVLKYRIVEKKQDGIPAMDMDTAGRYGIADGIQAIKVVRQHAAEWGVSPSRIGFLGFSAGAMVTSGALLQPDSAARPSFAGLIYGGPFGAMPPIPASLPPMFLAWARDDRVALDPVVRFHDALTKAGHQPEVHIFDAGGHGFGMRKQGTDSDHWIEAFYNWMEAQGLTRSQRSPAAVPAGRLRVALVKQPFLPTGQSPGPTTMAEGGIQQILQGLGAETRVEAIGLTREEDTEYGGWKRLGMALGHFADVVARNEREGWFTVGLLATCPSMPGLVAGLQRSGPAGKPLKIGMLWLDAHPDFNTPETTRSGSLGGMPVAVATGRALRVMRLDAKLDPPLADRHIVMAGVRLTDPLEQELLDKSGIQQLSVDDLRHQTPAVFAQLDRLSRLTDKIYIHIDMDVLDPAEVMGHGNKVADGPSSEQLAALFEQIFRRYPKASAIGFATIPGTDEGGLSLAAVNRMIAGAVRGLRAREAH